MDDKGVVIFADGRAGLLSAQWRGEDRSEFDV